MKVTRVAETVIYPGDMMLAGMQGLNVHDGPADQLAVFAGRACYQSWSRPNPKTATNEGYLRNILAKRHESVLEHASVTYYIEGVSRNLTHELVRHRHLSFSELSQRFVDMSVYEPVLPPLYKEHGWELCDQRDHYDSGVQALTKRGYSRKQAREAARAELLSSMETKIVVTGNHRAWRDVLEKRGSLGADAEIRLLALELFKDLRGIAPNTYQDFTIEKEGSTEWLKKNTVETDIKAQSVSAPALIESMRGVMEQVALTTGMTQQELVEALLGDQKSETV